MIRASTGLGCGQGGGAVDPASSPVSWACDPRRRCCAGRFPLSTIHPARSGAPMLMLRAGGCDGTSHSARARNENVMTVTAASETLKAKTLGIYHAKVVLSQDSDVGGADTGAEIPHRQKFPPSRRPGGTWCASRAWLVGGGPSNAGGR